ncbi:MAG TPA: ATP-dependent Clp protease proteolytic subunit, partial [Spirochaetota bacterium]|nr:ATP-dependent Clp protease proteolytic subunit [Spirochaetota bacterium]
MRSYFIIFLLFFTTAFAGTRELPAGKYHNVYYIKKIDQITVDAWYHTYLQDSIRSAEEHKADLIIIELDTPGGSVKEATKIVNLMSSTRADLIVYINQDAISAGAYISLAADFI